VIRAPGGVASGLYVARNTLLKCHAHSATSADNRESNLRMLLRLTGRPRRNFHVARRASFSLRAESRYFAPLDLLGAAPEIARAERAMVGGQRVNRNASGLLSIAAAYAGQAGTRESLNF